LTVSRKENRGPFTQDGVNVLSTLMSNANLAYDNLFLMKRMEQDEVGLQLLEKIASALNSSLTECELIQSILFEILKNIHFNIALVLVVDKNCPDQIYILEPESTIPGVHISYWVPLSINR